MDDGGSVVTNYVVERKDVATAQWSPLSTTSKKKSHMAKHLNEGNQYLFRVAAENQYGRGPFVETPKPIKALDPLRELFSLNKELLFGWLEDYHSFMITFLSKIPQGRPRTYTM